MAKKQSAVERPWNGHHVWCNGDHRTPADTCRWCSGERGMHALYPMTDDDPIGINLAAKHFPDAIPINKACAAAANAKEK